MSGFSVNPLLPLDDLIPDVEARVFPGPDGEERLYLYGSHDEFGSDTWCSYQYHVYSAPLSDLSQWTDHGVSFASRPGQGYTWQGKDCTGTPWTDARLYAPDVICIEGLYYLVTCHAGGPCLGMAFSKTPEGPFSPAVRILYDDGTETSCIDPSLYAEESTGKVYLLWGQRASFRGARGLQAAELEKDGDGHFTVVKKETETVLFTGVRDEFGFYEGASLRKINGRYYILYPSDHGKGVHMMSYAVADAPLGPYHFGGDILDSDGCDPEPGNNHGSFCQIRDQWYLFYHRGFNNSNMQRRVCAEKIYFDDSGRICAQDGGLVPMTNHGLGGPQDPFRLIQAAWATHVRLDGFPSGCYLTQKAPGLHVLTQIGNGQIAEFRDFDFGSSREPLLLSARVFSRQGGDIQVLADDPGSPVLGTIPVPADLDGWVSGSVGSLSGVRTLYLRFRCSGSFGELAGFRFSINR